MADRALAAHTGGDILAPVRPAALVFVLAAACRAVLDPESLAGYPSCAGAEDTQ